MDVYLVNIIKYSIQNFKEGIEIKSKKINFTHAIKKRLGMRVSITSKNSTKIYCDVFTGYSDTNLPRDRVSATSN
jgi:hypothetical protein